MNRKTLKFEIDFDFILLAITCPLKDYRLCYLINKNLQFNFTKSDDLEIQFSLKNAAYFSLYEDVWESSETAFFLIANRGSEGFLIPEMNRIDYFLIIRNFIEDEEISGIIAGLNRLPEVVTAVSVDPKKIKSRENLIF
ncbi:MAG: IPExxxVDY family protein [Sphingobacteriaceae bacterium]